MSESAHQARALGYTMFAGFAATFVGIGLSRFAYTPLVPVVVEAGWFTEEQAAYLGAANLVGYLFGALSAHGLAGRYGVGRLMRLGLAAVPLSYVVCVVPAPFVWFFLWRLLAGTAGAWLMVLAAPAVLARVPARLRGRAGAVVFTGIGGGVLLSATAVPALAERGAGTAWLGIAVLAAVVATAVWPYRWTGSARDGADNPDEPGRPASGRGPGGAVLLVFAAYVLFAVGFVPHTVFWVDYLARVRDLGLAAGGGQWALFGAGAVAGPVLAGWLADRIGARAALSGVLIAMGVGTVLPFPVPGMLAVTVSSLLVGAAVPAVVALTSGFLAELVGAAEHRRTWGRATAVFSLAQAGAGYGMSAAFDLTGSYEPLFLTAGLALLLGGMCVAGARATRPSRRDTVRAAVPGERRCQPDARER